MISLAIFLQYIELALSLGMILNVENVENETKFNYKSNSKRTKKLLIKKETISFEKVYLCVLQY